MKKYTWTLEEIEFLKENYPKYGVNFCIQKLGYNKSKIQSMTNKLNIKLLSETRTKIMSKSPEKCNINPNLFLNIKSKEIAYLLGVIWSDGFLNPSNNGNNYNIGFTMVKEDINKIKIVLDSIGKWHYFERKYINGWKPSINVITNNKRIYNFLVEHDYDKKSYVSADKILSKIPDNLKHYFFRGVIDGDGCFYYREITKNNLVSQFTLASTYEQDWSYFEEICKTLDIKYTIQRIKRDNSTSSSVRITNKIGIKKLGDFIYKNYKHDKIGLPRKYEKFIIIRESLI